MDPKSILMIAYYFPPDSSAAVFRPLRFLKELVGREWRTTVICCDPYRYERYDPQLLEQVPSAVRIIRVKSRDPWCAFQAWRGVRTESRLAISSSEEAQQLTARHHAPWRSKLREAIKWAEALVYRPDIAMSWIRPATRQGIAVCRQVCPNVVWATIGPLSAGVVAYRVSLATGVPYVLDFRDPWGLGYYPEELRRPAWAKARDDKALFKMFERAQAVVFMFESIAEQYMKVFREALPPEKIHIIPNGFDGKVEPFTHAPGDRCTVLYAGTLRTYRYDTLLEGLLQLKREDPGRAARLRLLFVGEGLRGLAERVADLDLGDMVETAPPIPSVEIRQVQRHAHALLVLGRTSGRKGHDLVAGAKLFGYLQAGRPIIGVLPQDETRRILHKVGRPLVADADSSHEVVAILRTVVDAWSNSALESFVPDPAACDVFSSKRQIEALLCALGGIPRSKLFEVSGVGEKSGGSQPDDPVLPVS